MLSRTAAALLAAVLVMPVVAEAQQVAAPAPSSAATAKSVTVPSGELISVQIQSDIGSRISNEGDTFGVLTVSDYYVRGALVLPKGSPGYGVVSHVKRSGSWHSGGEVSFTVKRLVAPDGSEIAVETNGSTSDADKQTEKNGSEIGQYLLWGVGVFAKRGNDMLVKKGATFHVATMQTKDVPVIAFGTKPADLDTKLIKATP